MGKDMTNLGSCTAIELCIGIGTRMKTDGAVYVHRCSWQLGPNITCYKIVGVAGRGPFCMQRFSRFQHAC